MGDRDLSLEIFNPLFFMPSPRNIPEVLESWKNIHHDKFIVKHKPQKEAYAEAKEVFLEHKEYTHLVICPDDLVLTEEEVESLLDDALIEEFRVVDGICNLDESDPDTWSIQPEGCKLTGNKPDVHHGAWYMTDKKPKLPDEMWIKVGHSGCACRVINRETFEKLSFTGANNGEGWFDYQMSKELKELGIPIWINTHCKFWHMRNNQKPQTQNGFSYWSKENIS